MNPKNNKRGSFSWTADFSAVRFKRRAGVTPLEREDSKDDAYVKIFSIECKIAENQII
jgi:hypothetical protein